MGNVILFRPKRELEAAARLQEFVSFARTELTTFGKHLDFEGDVWDITEFRPTTGRAISQHRLRFTRQGERGRLSRIPMSEPFASFTKAYIRYQETLRPTKSPYMKLMALRALEKALGAGGRAPDLTKADHAAFTHAAQILAEKLGVVRAHQAALELEKVSVRLIEFGIVVTKTPWRSHLKKPDRAYCRVGPEFDERRRRYLPSQAALEAIPKIFRKATTIQDVVGTATVALLLCAPGRLSEVLSLPVDCVHLAKDRATGEERYGLRWWPAKGANPTIKWVIPSMRFIAETAIEKIRMVTEPARALARWYDEHPDRLYLAQQTECLRGRKYLSMHQVAAILGWEKSDSARDWCKDNSVPLERNGRLACARFEDIERAVLKLLPRGFPYVPGTARRYSESLFVMRRQELNTQKATYVPSLSTIDYHHVKTLLGANSKWTKMSIFSRHGLCEENGEFLTLGSHQIRHYLNTIAQQGGLSQLDIAKWSGRKYLKQNADYDHESADALLARLRDAIGDSEKIEGPLGKLPARLPVTREEFATLRAPTALVTDSGFCIHDWSMSTCPHHVHCIDCEDHVYTKNERTRRTIRAWREDAEILLHRAEMAQAQEHFGANRWADKHRATLDRLVRLEAMLENPCLPEGHIVHLADRGNQQA